MCSTCRELRCREAIASEQRGVPGVVVRQPPCDMLCSRRAHCVDFCNRSDAFMSSIVKPLQACHRDDAESAQPVIVDLPDPGRGKAQISKKLIFVSARNARFVQASASAVAPRVRSDTRGCQELQPTHKRLSCCVNCGLRLYKAGKYFGLFSSLKPDEDCIAFTTPCEPGRHFATAGGACLFITWSTYCQRLAGPVSMEIRQSFSGYFKAVKTTDHV